MAKYILLGLYIIFILFAGLVNRKNASTSEDFFLGGRGVGPFLSAFAFVTTYVSAVAIVNAGKIAWGHGLGVMFNAAGNVLLGIVLVWVLLGKKTRTMTQQLNTATMPDFLKARYDSSSFKVIGALIIFIFMVPYSGSVFMGLSYMFENIFHIPYEWALVCMTVLTAIYLTIGGYKAVALADAIQGIIMVVGSIFIMYFLFTSPVVGGFVEGWGRIKQINPDFTSFTLGGWKNWSTLLPIILLTSLGPLGMPQMAQKFFAIDDPRSIKAAAIICSIAGLIIIFGMHFIGFYNHLFFAELPLDPQTGLPNADLLSPQMLEMFLPELMLAVAFLFIVSASMSTLAGLVLVSSSSIAMDLLKGYLYPAMDDKKVTLIMRILCVLFVLFSLVIAINKPTSILTLMSVSWGAISGFFLSPYIYGILWKGTTRSGALTGGIVGLLLAALLPLVFGVNATLACAYALVIPLVVTPLVSAFTRKFSKEHIDFVFGINEDEAAEEAA
jgi:SSS family solute:Na+ symporter